MVWDEGLRTVADSPVVMPGGNVSIGRSPPEINLLLEDGHGRYEKSRAVTARNSSHT